MKSYMRIISERPKCRICGKLMHEWFAFAENHVHPDCLAKDITNSLLEGIEEDLKTVNKN